MKNLLVIRSDKVVFREHFNKLYLEIKMIYKFKIILYNYYYLKHSFIINDVVNVHFFNDNKKIINPYFKEKGH
jgi:hypothetical protein